MTDYSTQHVSQELISEIVHALRSVNQYGSVEIYVQNSTITQITIRNIKKTQVSVNHGVPPKKDRSTINVVSRIHT